MISPYLFLKSTRELLDTCTIGTTYRATFEIPRDYQSSNFFYFDPQKEYILFSDPLEFSEFSEF